MNDRLKGSPPELADYLLELSGDYAFNAGLWEDIQNTKSDEWLKLRSDCTSDTQADRKWTRTEQGKNETILKSKLKTLAMLMSSIKCRLRVFESEARNLF